MVSNLLHYAEISTDLAKEIAPFQNSSTTIPGALAGGHYLAVELGEIDAEFLTDLVLTEDENFYQHNGVDFLATMAAIQRYIQVKYLGVVFEAFQNQKLFGGSTITQQLVKNLLQHKNRVIAIKFKEILIALMVEQKLAERFTKKKLKAIILKKYLEIFYVTKNFYGLKYAAYLFLNKDTRVLPLSSRIVLLAVINRPSVMNRKAPVRKKKLYRKIIRRLVACNRIHDDASLVVKIAPGFSSRLKRLADMYK